MLGRDGITSYTSRKQPDESGCSLPLVPRRNDVNRWIRLRRPLVEAVRVVESAVKEGDRRSVVIPRGN